LAVLFLWLGTSAFVAWQQTRRKVPPFPEPAPKVSWGDVKTQRLPTSDGQQIGAWFVRGDPHQACVLLLHGNGTSRREMLHVMRWLGESQYSILAISLRCHGDSTGAWNDFGWSARYDVLAAVEFLERACPGQRIHIVARSLGAAAAIFAAGELQERVAGYFLEQAYKDLDTAVWNRLEHRLPPVLDWLAYSGLRLWAPVFLPVAPDQISPYNRVQDIPATVPILLVTGAADQHARLADVTEVYRRVVSHAKLVVFEGATHEALDRREPERYREVLLTFLEAS
jgi:alpha-beta hydrolase superfamily lysophospholipase